MEDLRRPVDISLEQARRWFKEGGELRKLALYAFSMEELNPPRKFDSIFLGKEPESVVTVPTIVPKKMNSGKDGDKWMEAYSFLLRAARVCNNGWTRTSNNTGYFFIKNYKYSFRFSHPREKPYRVCSHSNLKIPGVVYFKDEKDCMDVANFLQNKGLLSILW